MQERPSEQPPPPTPQGSERTSIASRLHTVSLLVPAGASWCHPPLVSVGRAFPRGPFGGSSLSTTSMMAPSEVRRELRRTLQPVEKLPLCTLSPQIGHQIRRFWGVSSPIRGRNQLNADFFNRLTPSPTLGE